MLLVKQLFHKESIRPTPVHRSATAPDKIAADKGADYPKSRFGDTLKQIAELAKSGVGLEIAFADVGGRDTHVGD